MATISENIAAILEQAEVMDDLISQFRAAAALISAAETEIRKAQPFEGHDTISGRIRLVHYANALTIEPNIEGRKSVAALATAAWEGVQ